MRRSIIILMVVLLLASIVMPAYADKRMENNKKIAEFVLDTIKLPYLIIGAFVKQDYEEVKADLDYKGHKGLGECLRKQESNK